MDRVASTPKWAAATTGSAVGSAIADPRAQISAAPQATSPTEAAARKLSGTDGGGTTAGTPDGRSGQEPDPGRGGTGGVEGTRGGAVIIPPSPAERRRVVSRTTTYRINLASSRNISRG